MHPSPCRPQVLVCVRVCAPRGRESVLHHWVPLLLGARPGRSLMTSLLPLAHHLVRSPFFPPSPLIPLLGEAREPRPPQRASLVCLFPFPSAAGSDHSFVLRFSQAPSLDLFSSFLCDSGCVFGWCCDLTTSFNNDGRSTLESIPPGLLSRRIATQLRPPTPPTPGPRPLLRGTDPSLGVRRVFSRRPTSSYRFEYCDSGLRGGNSRQDVALHIGEEAVYAK